MPNPANRQLVCVGRLSEQKGQLLILQAVARLRGAGEAVQLVMAGDGPLRQSLEQYIRDNGLAEIVRVTGWVSGAQVRQLIQDSRAVVLPSFAEGLPVVIMEALALRRPVIATYIAGIPELVRPGENGWLVPAGNVDALVSGLKSVLDASPAQLEAMGQAGAEAVRQMHNIDIEARKLAQLFRMGIAGFSA
jgi:glycosyltransferase involved in cell wall biosynthesis